MPNKDKSSMGVDFLREEGSKPELYTEEHEKLLGSTEMSWTLFVDGYGKDGKRIYDPVRGKTCHQCRSAALSSQPFCFCIHYYFTTFICRLRLRLRFSICIVSESAAFLVLSVSYTQFDLIIYMHLRLGL